jgi:myo-inositol 2-dehydrogenase / D-chiro-inositol 1-dehydrogenase
VPLTRAPRPLRVGLVGGGFIAGRHAGSLAAIQGVQVAAVADPLPARAEALAARAGARAYSDHRWMLDAEALDAVYVCVPPFAHGPPELAALERGLPLFVEKPIAIDTATAETVAAEVARRGVVTATGYHWRYLDTVERAAELLAADPCRLLLGWWLDKAAGPDWWLREAGSGGQLVEQTTHLFDLARLLVGEVVRVHAEGGRFPRRSDLRAGDVLDVSTATLRFASGAVGSISSSCLLRRGHRVGLELICEGLALGLTETELVVDDGRSRQVLAAGRDPLAAEDRDFVAAVRGEPAAVRAPYAEALRTHRLTLAAARAAGAGLIQRG